MEVSQVPDPSETATTALSSSHSEPVPFEQCDQCGAAVDRTQRYCVNCGTRRRHVHDPAARHLSRVTAGARAAARQSTARPTRRPGTVGLGTAVALAVIPLAVGLGVLIGRASTNGDQKLLAELRAPAPHGADHRRR